MRLRWSSLSPLPTSREKPSCSSQGREPSRRNRSITHSSIDSVSAQIHSSTLSRSVLLPIHARWRRPKSHQLRFPKCQAGWLPTMGNVGLRAGRQRSARLNGRWVPDIDKLIYLGAANSTAQYVFNSMAKLGLDSIDKLRARSGLKWAHRL